jgi:quinol monooxygenase YgiN
VREVIVMAVVPAQNGKEEDVVSACKIRSAGMIKLAGCRWCDVNAGRRDKDGIFRVLVVTVWEDVNLFRQYAVKDAHFEQAYQKIKGKIIDDKFSIAQFQRVRNPFHTVVGGRRGESKSDLQKKVKSMPHNDTDTDHTRDNGHPYSFDRPTAFAILIELFPDPAKLKEMQQLLCMSETCTKLEPGCLRYEVLSQWEEEQEQPHAQPHDSNEQHEENHESKKNEEHQEKNQNFHFVVYVVFTTEADYKTHTSNGYSLSGDRAKELCYNKEPMVSNFFRE